MEPGMKVPAAILCICLFSAHPAQADIVYANDFDGNTQFGSGTTVAISGGTGTAGGVTGGITSTQGFNAFTGFGGDFWRVTAPDDVLEFAISNLPAHDQVSVSFSLGLLDSWDGTSDMFGTDIINVAIFDGANLIAGFSEAYSSGNAPSSNVESIIVQNQQLGFNNNDPFWNEDGYRIAFNDIAHTSGNLTLRLWASSGGIGSGFQGGNDESFAIDELLITATPEPTSLSYLLIAAVATATRRRRRSM